MTAPAVTGPPLTLSLIVTVGGTSTPAPAVKEKLSMARPWSLPASLFSTQRSHRVSPTAHGVPLRSSVPPTPGTRPAPFPSTAAPVPVLVKTGDDQLNRLPAAVQVGTAVKSLPKPYSRVMVWAAGVKPLLPPSRHCSPLK